MPTARYYAVGAVHGNVFYVAGGYPGSPPYLKTVEKYTVNLDTWVTGSPSSSLSAPRCAAAV
jgi:hypothetical protein